MLLLTLVVPQLKDALAANVRGEQTEVDMLSWINRTTLELVGQGGLGYSLDSLVEQKSNTYGDAIKTLLCVHFAGTNSSF